MKSSTARERVPTASATIASERQASLLSCAPSQVGCITDSWTVVGHPEGYRSRTRMNLQVVKEPFEVRSDGPPGDPEHRRDLLVFETERDERDDLRLACGEERRRRRSV